MLHQVHIVRHLALIGSMRLFFFTDPATPQIYPLSLHDALPIWPDGRVRLVRSGDDRLATAGTGDVLTGIVVALLAAGLDRKSTRLNSSHSQISYAVFCLKKKKTTRTQRLTTHEPTETANVLADT